MHDRARHLIVISIALSLIATLCLCYSTTNRFHGREFGNVTADGSVSAMPDYVQWEAMNDRFAAIGLVFVVIGAAIQVIAAYSDSHK